MQAAGWQVTNARHTTVIAYLLCLHLGLAKYPWQPLMILCHFASWRVPLKTTECGFFIAKSKSVESSSTTQALTPMQILEIREQILLRSINETILNEELFGPVQPDTIVIAVQVHNRIEYLRHLIVSMAQARDIDSVLLIFSHDLYDEDINQLVTTIDFCKV
ncbi:unnamed protein product, partial [Meganyctiphanes norvegica]